MSDEKPFRPMKGDDVDLGSLRLPKLASPKIDGIRCLAMGGEPRSNSMKVLPNRHLQRLFGEHSAVLNGLDGELTVGEPWAEDVYRRTNSAVMGHEGEPEVTFRVFDRWDMDQAYAARMHAARERVAAAGLPWVVFVEHSLILDVAALEAYEEEVLAAGYEGVMLRCPDGPYKQGRATAREQFLLKVKRWTDNEARIVGWYEEMHNANEAKKNELGRTKRSTAQAGLVGKGTLGGFEVVGVNGRFEGVPFDVGGGFTAAQRVDFWARREKLAGSIVTYKHFDVGVKDKPRHPIFKDFRDPIDMMEAA